MILANYGVVSSSGGALSYDADALAFMTAAAITDNTQKTAVNTLVTDLKTYNIWTKIQALYPFVGGSALSHKWNLKDPRDLDVAYRLTFNGGWTHSSTGALPNGTTAFANTYFNPSVNGVLNSHHLSYYPRTNRNTSSVDMGVGSHPNYNIMEINVPTTTTRAIINQSSLTTNFTDTNSLGLYVGNRTASNSVSIWKNGVSRISDSATSTSLLNGSILIGAMNDIALTATLYFSNKETCFATIGAGLTNTEVANFYTAVQAYQTTLSRNI